MNIFWRLGLSGDFATASNWDPATVPGPADDVIIGVNGTYAVTSFLNQTVASLSVLDGAAKLFITGHSSFSTTSGVNDGTIIVDASSFSIESFLSSQGLFVNSGTLEATNTENLSIGSSIIFSDETITNMPQGIIEANGANTSVVLGLFGNTTIVGGTLKARGANAAIVLGATGALASDGTISGGTTLDGSQPGNPVTIEGNVVSNFEAAIGLIGTINNEGVITMQGGAFPWLVCEGNVTLEGGGDIKMTNDTPILYLAPSIFGGVLTNVDNTISGTGVIGQIATGAGLGSFVGTFINEAKGSIDADASGPLLITGIGPDTNAGLIEATQAGTLLIDGISIDNFLNHEKGTIEAGENSTIALENATIIGGFVRALSGSIVEAKEGSSTISGADLKNAGTIGAEGASLIILGDIHNEKGNLDADNGVLVIDGAVKHGTATIEGAGTIEFCGSSSADVTFGASFDATLKLDLPSAFKGMVAGFTTGDYIDLPNINLADDPTFAYSPKTDVLSVEDSVTGVTDTIKFEGSVGPFTAQSDGNGGILISDPPAVNVLDDGVDMTSPMGVHSAAPGLCDFQFIGQAKDQFDAGDTITGVHSSASDLTDVNYLSPAGGQSMQLTEAVAGFSPSGVASVTIPTGEASDAYGLVNYLAPPH